MSSEPSRYIEIYTTENVYYNFDAITGALDIDINPHYGWNPNNYIVLAPGMYHISGTNQKDLTVTALNLPSGYNSKTLSATVTTEPCKDGHIWDYVKDTCSLCNLSLEDYRKGLDKKRYDEQKCECGSEIAGFTSHSFWCRRYTKP
jgi:hypothetical protein